MRVEAAAVRGDVQSEQVWYTAATSDTERAVHEGAAVREGAAVQRGVRSERVCVEATSDTERAVRQEGAAVRRGAQSELLWVAAATSDTERAGVQGDTDRAKCVTFDASLNASCDDWLSQSLLKSAASDADRTDSKSGPPLRAGHLSKR